MQYGSDLWRLRLLLVSILAGTVAFGQQARILYLSGHGKDDPVEWEFMCTAGSRAGQWTRIPVPSNWEMYGFGTLNYGRDDRSKPVEQGIYRYRFDIPEDWEGLRIFIWFEGVMTDTSVVINGISAGPKHRGGFYRFGYEITELVRCGRQNLLEVTVDKLSADESVNRAERQGDYWVFGGIYRPVYLQALPRQFIEDVAIDARADGTFTMHVDVNGIGPDLVEARITDLDGRPAGQTFSAPVREGKALLQTKVGLPKTWSAETPHLYLVHTMLMREGRLVHYRIDRFGFRTFEVRKGDGLYLNGSKIILKGVNRHSFWPDSGRCLSESVHRMDIGLIKQMNMNAVRMSHYPPDPQFLDLCDELGLYVLDELAGWQKPYDAEVGRSLVRQMVVRDRNHPCILFWNNGNEGGWNTQLDAEFSRWDIQGRPVLHPWARFSGVNTAHYQTYQSTARLCQAGEIFMPTEFLHGLFDGGAGAGLEDYWNLMLKGREIGGGFIWALVDEGLKRPDTGIIDVAGNAAPDGILGPYRQKEASFFAIKQIWSPIVVLEKELPDDFDGSLTLENRYSFIDTSRCRFICELRRFGVLRSVGISPNSGSVVCKVVAPTIGPGQKGKLRIELPANWRSYDGLSLRVRDPDGQELWTWVWPLPGADRFHEVTNLPTRYKVKCLQHARALEVIAGPFVYVFSAQDGLLTSVKHRDTAFSLANGPRLLAGQARLISIQHGHDGNDYTIEARYEGQMELVRWRIRDNGWLHCDYAYSAQGPHDLLGIGFDYPQEKVRAKTWLGDGPYPVWKNRLAGVTFGLWSNNYNDTITGWSVWEYPPFKGFFSNVRWLQLDTDEGPITIVLPKAMFVQVLRPSLPPEQLLMRTAVSLPDVGLGMLHAIPPIGNKFHTADQTGPQGQPTMAEGTYTGSVMFYFGPLPL